MWRGYLENVFNERYRAGSADANGRVVHSIGPVPEGYCWYLNNSTLYSNTAVTTATFEIFASNANQRPTDNTKSGRQDYTTGTNIQNAANNYASPLYFGPGQYVLFVWAGLTQGDLVAWSGQLLSHKLELHPVRTAGVTADAKPPHAVVTPDQIAVV